ncbi:MAG: hypothetical protein IJU29_01770, partial [Oscillospiraceae bacterium]|nr:hypothetical protein [Oscillospiraceae bacterium]
GGNLTLRGNISEMPWLELDGDDAAAYTVTVEQGAAVRLHDNELYFPQQFSLVNNGTIDIYRSLSSEGHVTNNGAITLRAYREGDSEREEDNHRFGTLTLAGEDAVLDNNGTLEVQCIRFTNSNGDEDGRFGELHVRNGAALRNNAGGKLENRGFLYLRRQAVLENAGTLGNYELLEAHAGEDRYVVWGASAQPEQTGSGGPCTVKNTGKLFNDGRMQFLGSALELSGDLANDGELWLEPAENCAVTTVLELVFGEPKAEDWERFWGGNGPGSWWGILEENSKTLGADYLPSIFIDKGATLTNGVLTSVGEGYNGSHAWFRQSGGTIVNNGVIVTNGDMNLENVAYSQNAGAALNTYNAGGLHITGGSLTVPSGSKFLNMGYMNVTDRFGDGYQPCDLTGFPDFFTDWNQDGNESNWCDFIAEVSTEEGYRAAVAEQRQRAENFRYNRLDFINDITFTSDVVLADFGDYWLNAREAERWRVWDETVDGWRDVDPDTEGAERYTVNEGITLTVTQDATLTVAADNSLRVDGERGQMVDHGFSPCRLVINGTLRIEAGQEGNEENDWNWKNEGLVEIWSFGSFDASAGNVVNDGRFEVRYYEMGHWEGDRYVHDGVFEHPAACPVIHPPENAACAAEVRSEQGMRNAAASKDPEFDRLYIREDCTVTLNGDLTLPQNLNIEPASGLIIWDGVLTVDGHFWNDGDVSVWGDLVINGSMDNNQSIEVGEDGDGVSGRLVVYGYLELRDRSIFTLWPTGRLLLMDGSELQNYREEAVPVTLEGTPRFAGNARITNNGGAPIQLSVAGDGDECHFWNCTFEDGTTIVVDGAWMVWDNDDQNYYNGMDFELTTSAGTYRVDPHIFGTRGDGSDPGVYIGIDDSGDDQKVEYHLYLDGDELQFRHESGVDGQPKTHLSSVDGEKWFTANEIDDPNLSMTIVLPGEVTITYNRVPVKPEWNEPWQDEEP